MDLFISFADMNHYRKSHEDCRLETCICCGGKVKPQTGRTKITPVSPKIAEEIREHAKPEFTPDVASYPLGVCQRCRLNLIRCEKKVDGKKTGPSKGIKEIWDSFKLQKIYIPRNQDSLTCSCDICIARRTGFRNVKVVPRGERDEVVTSVEEKPKTLCSKCFQEDVRAGIRHRCGSSARKENLAKLILQKEDQAEQVAANVLKSIAEKKGVEVGRELQLKQQKGGRVLTVAVGRQKRARKRVIQVKSLTVAKLRKRLKLSDRAAETACRILREDGVKVEPNTRKFLSELDQMLKPFFEDKVMVMQVKKTVKEIKTVRTRGGKMNKKVVEVKKVVEKEKHIAIVKDLPVFLQTIAQMRNIPLDKAVYRVCQDGGGGSFKTVVSVMESGGDPSIEPKGELLSGVNRLLPLALCPGVPEKHHNLRQIMEHLQFHKVPHLKVVMDLCLLNAILGISAHGGKFSCSWCDGPSPLQSGTLRTFAHLKENYQKYVATGFNPAKMKECANVVQECLTVADPEATVMDVHPLPPLHLLMGVVNHLVKLCISVDSSTLEVLKRHNIFRHGYNGGGLDGNNSKK